jgi:predicted polyphosphate/ATP-dependent NAD kinase
MTRIGFLINPIAGMGGRVGLKGTDGVLAEAIRLGAEPVASDRALEMLRELHGLLDGRTPAPPLDWLTCSGAMGADALAEAGFAEFRIMHSPGSDTGSDDTIAATRRFLEEGADIVLFCGGDGTARDIATVTQEAVPILGIPSGVKMYSGVFGVTPQRTAEILLGFAEGRLSPATVEILDLDEERYRAGEWAVRLWQSATTPFEPDYTQAAKALITEAADADVKEDIALYVAEEIGTNPDILFLLGPGSTVQSIGRRFGIDKTLLGIDAIADERVVGTDLNEGGILALLDQYPHRRLVLSPIGAQGFVLGRGNLQISPAVIRRIGPDNIVVVATPAKIRRTPVLRFDTGDRKLDAELAAGGYIPVVTGYRRRRLVKVSA